jgi:hypothetical protein
MEVYMPYRFFIATALLIMVFRIEVYAQVGALTVLGVKDALVSTLQEFRQALNEATQDAKSVGNSLQANAQNVIRDIDVMLGKKLAYTFDRLDAQERRLADDAERLTALIRDSTEALTRKNYERARVLIADADILAYNTSYSLPCRTTRPRIIAISPNVLNSDDEAPVVRIRGNFLMQGEGLSIKVDGTAAELQQRSDNEIAFLIPQIVMQKARNKQTAVTASVQGLIPIQRSISLLLGCRESRGRLDAIPSVGFLIDPATVFRVSGNLVTTHLVNSVVPDLEGRFERTGSDRCDDAFSVDQNFCLVGAGKFHHVDIWNQNANCGSAIGPVNPSGDRCVFIGGQVRGCGANRGPFNTWVGCKGRGWVKYNYKLWRQDATRVETGRSQVEKSGIPGETSFSFVFPGATSSPEYLFEIVVEKIRGGRVLERRSLSHAKPTVDNWVAKVDQGMMTVQVK